MSFACVGQRAGRPHWNPGRHPFGPGLFHVDAYDLVVRGGVEHLGHEVGTPSGRIPLAAPLLGAWPAGHLFTVAGTGISHVVPALTAVLLPLSFSCCARPSSPATG